MQDERYIEKLNSKYSFIRINAYKRLLADTEPAIAQPENANCDYHVRTVYSCYERTPSLAVYQALRSGASMIGVVDHASFFSAKELRKTAERSGVAYFSGAEVTLSSDNFRGKTVSGIMLGVPKKNISSANAALAPYRKLRNDYACALVKKLNAYFRPYEIEISFYHKAFFAGGKSVPGKDRAFLLLAGEIMKKFVTGEEILGFLTRKIGVELSDDDRAKLEDVSNPLYLSDLAAALSGSRALKLPVEKCKPCDEFIELCKREGGIAAAVYVDGNPSEFIKNAKSTGFDCVVFPQLEDTLLQSLYDECVAGGMLPLCREVIEFPRKKFSAVFGDAETARKFNEAAFAVVGHEISVSFNVEDGLFSARSADAAPDLSERIKLFSRIGAKGRDINERK